MHMLVLLCSLALAETNVSVTFVNAITPAKIAQAVTPIEVGSFTYQKSEGKLKCKAGPACTVTWNGKTAKLQSVANSTSLVQVEFGGEQITLSAAPGGPIPLNSLVENQVIVD
jgi:hypothetical protein